MYNFVGFIHIYLSVYIMLYAGQMLTHAFVLFSFLAHPLSLILGLFGMMMQEDISCNSPNIPASH